MRLATLGLACFILLAACGGGNDVSPADMMDSMRARAKPAEKHLVEIRDALVAYHGKHNREPESVSDLADVGLPLSKLAGNEDYSELGYAFYSVSFGGDGKLRQAWLIATPMKGREALTVRMNGVTGEFDYTAPGERLGAAPSDPPVNKAE
jgi:hypothetical protein